MHGSMTGQGAWGWPSCDGAPCDGVGGAVLVCDLEADPGSVTAVAFTGAHGGRGAVVEYLVDAGATGASVEVAIDSGGVSADWTDTAIAAGFRVHNIGYIAPGAKITLTVAAAMARVRWCETVSC